MLELSTRGNRLDPPINRPLAAPRPSAKARSPTPMPSSSEGHGEVFFPSSGRSIRLGSGLSSPKVSPVRSNFTKAVVCRSGSCRRRGARRRPFPPPTDAEEPPEHTYIIPFLWFAANHTGDHRELSAADVHEGDLMDEEYASESDG